MESAQTALAVPSSLFALAKELPVHGDEQLLAVLAEAPIAADSLDHIQACLVIPACDRQVAEDPRQRAGLQLQGTLQVGDVRRDRQRAADLPLRHRRLAHPGSLAKLALRQPAPGTGLDEHAPELVFLRCGRQGCSLVGRTVPRSMAHCFSSLCASFSRLPIALAIMPITLYHRFVSNPFKEPRDV